VAARQSAPGLGALCSSGKSKDGGYLSKHHWQLSLGYRQQYSHRHFVGTTEQTVRELQGTEVVNSVHMLDLGISFQFSPRWSLNVSAPILIAQRTIPGQLFRLRGSPNAQDQVSNTAGIGDMNVSARAWLFRPPTESRQNISLGFGMKFPTGDPGAQSTITNAQGIRQVTIVDQSIQPGDGGYGVSLDVQAFKGVKRATLFLSGSYLINPMDTNGVLTGRSQPSEAVMSVADQYLARAGVSYPLPKSHSVLLNFATRIEGVPVRDLIGSSNGFRRPGYALSLDPGFTYVRGREVWSFNLPIPVQRNRKRSVPDFLDGRAGDAAFADYVVIIGYSRRF
jgi:hypothetical protein